MTESNEIRNPVVAIRGVEESEKHMKFVDLASRRTTNVLHSMGVLQKCLDRHIYDYSKDETHKIFNAIEAQLDQLKSAAELGSSRGRFTF